MGRIWLASALSALAFGAVADAGAPAPREPVPALPAPQPMLAPQACICSPPTPLGDGQASHVSNCQCGALQCVIHVESGRLSCH
ncbi:MAG: hypothetical protein KDH20_05885 [Rhodocyclaceae bacterium]|nr:hypothetical protein [Rhodocyclaceae bacterium]